MSARGFTLVEVMIALVIVAIGITTLVGVSGQFTRQSAELRDRSLAHWIATNRLAEYRAEGAFPEPGTENGEITYAGLRWTWTAVITPAPGEDDLRRIDIRVVRADGARTSVTVTGFVGRIVGFVQAPPPSAEGT